MYWPSADAEAFSARGIEIVEKDFERAISRTRLQQSFALLKSQLSVLDECGCPIAAAHLDHALDVLRRNIGGSVTEADWPV